MTNGYIIVHNVCSEFEVPEMEKGVASNWQEFCFLEVGIQSSWFLFTMDSSVITASQSIFFV